MTGPRRRSKPEPPLHKRIRTFVEYHLGSGRSTFAPFTGQDRAAWTAFVYLLEIYAYGDDVGRKSALVAMGAVLVAAQPKVLDAFKKAIPGVLDWCNEGQIWTEIAPLATAPTGYQRDGRDIVWPCPNGERK